MIEIIAIIITLFIIFVVALCKGYISITPIEYKCTFWDTEVCPFIHDCSECIYYKEVDKNE